MAPHTPSTKATDIRMDIANGMQGARHGIQICSQTLECISSLIYATYNAISDGFLLLKNQPANRRTDLSKERMKLIPL